MDYGNAIGQYGPPETGRLIVRRASNVTPEKIHWLREGLIPLGRVAGIFGFPDGHCYARILRLRFPAAPHGRWASDRPNRQGFSFSPPRIPIPDVLVPRLAGAGANLKRIGFMEAVKIGGAKRNFDFARDLEALRNRIRSMRRKHQVVRLVVIDPITAYLGDIHRNNPSQIRALLVRLEKLAAEFQLAIVFVAHRTRSARRGVALGQIAGSYKFGAGPRYEPSGRW